MKHLDDILISSCLLVSCGSLNNTEIDPSLAPIVDKILSWCSGGPKCEIPSDLTKISKAKLSSNTLGVCRWYTFGYKHILVNSLLWDDLLPNVQEHVLAHEMAHCIWEQKEHEEEGLMKSGTYIRDTDIDAEKEFKIWYEKWKAKQ